jgi:hypothetical protein
MVENQCPENRIHDGVSVQQGGPAPGRGSAAERLLPPGDLYASEVASVMGQATLAADAMSSRDALFTVTPC